MASRGSGERLSTPGRRSRSPLPRVSMDSEAFGHFAELFARFMGTARFLAWMTIVIIVWIGFNVALGPGRAPDFFPFIFLTLLLSLQASYAAPLILLATNRQEARDRITAESDRRQAAQSRADMEYLAREMASLRKSVGELATRDYIRSEVRAELRALLAETEPEPEAGRADRTSPRERLRARAEQRLRDDGRRPRGEGGDDSARRRRRT